MLLSQIQATWGKKDSIDEVDGDMLMKSISHLVTDPYSMLKAALPSLRKSVAPRVIFMTSVEGRRGGTRESFTNAVAKGAVQSLVLNCASRLAKEGITVNGISKGAIPRVEPMNEDDINPMDMLSDIPMQRLGTPKDLAETICFMASEESGYLTGQVLSVSGGMEMG